MRHWPAPAVTPVVGFERVAQRAVCIRLQTWIEAGAHSEPALIHLSSTVALQELATNLAGEVRRSRDLRRVAPAQHDRLGLRLARLLRRDESGIGHAIDYPVPAI